MRRVVIDRPFIAGMVTDQPAYKLSSQQSAFAQDLIAPEGIARQRKGWAYSGTVADVADNLVSVNRSKYILADTTRTITVDNDSELRIHNATAAGTLQQALGSGQFLYRCTYRDADIYCAQDGEQPLRLYSGADLTGTTSGTSGTAAYVLGQATITGRTYSAAPGVGAYVRPVTSTGKYALNHWFRILESSTTSMTLEGVKASAAENLAGASVYSIGFTFPCVPIYSAGTVTFASGTPIVTGYGTKWKTGYTTIATTGFDNLVISPVGSDASVYEVGTVTSDTSLVVNGGPGVDVTAKSNYAIVRRCPFKDAQPHKGSLFGTGVAQYPNNVYVFPPGWNPSTPPGFVAPFNPTSVLTSANSNDFIADSISVPAAYDGDVNVAILSTPNPLLVLKRQTVYGIYGSYPNFSVDKIADGPGCIDIRSAISTANGQFWVGEHGIFAYGGGEVVDLTEGTINREWRALTRGFDYGTYDYCTIGQVYDHLFVSMVTGSGTASRCYVYDLRNRAWSSRFTNHKSRYFFSAQVDGEEEELYWVGDDDQGRVMTSACTVNGTGIAKDADGDSPRMQAWTGESIDGTQNIGDDTRLLDVALSTNVYDVGVAGDTKLGVSVVSGGSLESQTSATTTLTAIDSDAVDRADRTRFREVNSRGRLHQIRVDVSTLGTNDANTKIEIPEINLTFRDRRSRT